MNNHEANSKRQKQMLKPGLQGLCLGVCQDEVKLILLVLPNVKINFKML